MGIHLDGTRFETRNSLKRYGLVRKGLCAILNRRHTSSWVLEVVVGHCTCCGLVWYAGKFFQYFIPSTNSSESTTTVQHRCGSLSEMS